jgi:hypothetical protein
MRVCQVAVAMGLGAVVAPVLGSFADAHANQPKLILWLCASLFLVCATHCPRMAHPSQFLPAVWL